MSLYEVLVIAAFVFGSAFLAGWIISVVAEKMTEDSADIAEQDAAELMKQANKPTRRVRAGQPWSEHE